MRVIKAYERLALPKCWRDAKRASPDGEKWTLYGQNLLSEYHVRYGGYGGIGYYHVSDMYIALVGHFIPCGAQAVIAPFTSRSVGAGKNMAETASLMRDPVRNTTFPTKPTARRS